MGLSPISQFLGRHRVVGVDASIFIYQVEAHPKYQPLTNELFLWLTKTGNTGLTSTICMTELLVPTYREGDKPRIDNFYLLLTTFPNLIWSDVTIQIADLAAELRATYQLKTSAALQAATARSGGASGFITNDPAFTRITELETAVLDDLL